MIRTSTVCTLNNPHERFEGAWSSHRKAASEIPCRKIHSLISVTTPACFHSIFVCVFYPASVAFVANWWWTDAAFCSFFVFVVAHNICIDKRNILLNKLLNRFSSVQSSNHLANVVHAAPTINDFFCLPYFSSIIVQLSLSLCVCMCVFIFSG